MVDLLLDEELNLFTGAKYSSHVLRNIAHQVSTFSEIVLDVQIEYLLLVPLAGYCELFSG